MIEELIRRLKQRKLTEQEEQELFEEMEETKKIIAQNNIDRQIEQAKLENVKKEEEKFKQLQELDYKISLKQKKNKRLSNWWTILATITTVIACIGSIFAGTICALNNLPVLAILSPILCLVVPVCSLYPVAKLFAKKSCENDEEVLDLIKEKELILDDVEIDMEKIVLKNLKLTNLPKTKEDQSINGIDENSLTV